LELGFHTDFVYEFVTLLAVLDPTAAVPVFMAVTAGLSRRQSLQVAGYAVATAFLVLFFFICTGQFLLEALKIPMTSFQLAGSIILLLFGLKLVLGQVTAEAAAIPPQATMAQRAVFPLAIPTIAGAGSMLTVVLLTDNNVRSIAEQALTTVRMALVLVYRLLHSRSFQANLSSHRSPGSRGHESRIGLDPGQHCRKRHRYRHQIEFLAIHHRISDAL
jgi:multiple antibiotic resistance protein